MGIVDGAMIIQTEQKQSIQSDQFESKSFHIKEENMRFIASLLRNNYSDPMLASMREYLCNAIDASPEGEKIDVVLPTAIDRNFCVRDYGSGLSEEEMFDLFTSYGESTKRDSNEKIGAFGIGKVSALSYVDSFVIVSYHEGEKTSYTMRINDENDTNLVKLFSESTTERNGLMVQIPVPEQDLQTFEEKFVFSFHFLREKINLKNQIFRDFMFREQNDIFCIFEGASCADPLQRFIHSQTYDKIRNHSFVEMGGILYPINDINFDDYPAFSTDGLIYHAKMGEFKIHHSRETLEFNEQTKQNLKKASDIIFEKIVEDYVCEVKNLTNLWDATLLINKIEKHLEKIIGGRGFVTRQSKRKIVESIINSAEIPDFNGERPSKLVFDDPNVILEIHSVSIKSNGTCSFSKVNRGSFNHLLNPINEGKFHGSDYYIYVVDDSPTPHSARNRIENSGIEVDQPIVFIKPISLSGMPDSSNRIIQRAKAFQCDNIKLLSEMPRRKIKRSVKSQGTSYRNKGDVLLFNVPNNPNAYGMKYRFSNSEFWQENDIEDPDQGTYYYVRYYMNKPMKVNLHGDEFMPLQDFFDLVDFINKENPIKVYGIKNKSIEKFADKKNWIPFEDVFASKMLECTSMKNNIKRSQVSAKFLEFDINIDRFYSEMKEILEDSKQESVIKDFLAVMEEFKNTQKLELQREYSVANLNELSSLIPDSEIPEAKDECEIIESFFKAYPMLVHALKSYSCKTSSFNSDMKDYLLNW